MVRVATAAWQRARSRDAWLETKVAVVGAGGLAACWLEAAGDDASVRVMGVFDGGPWREPRPPGGLVRGTIDDLVVFARDRAVDAIVIAWPLSAHSRVDDARERLAGVAADIYVVGEGAGPWMEPDRCVRFCGAPMVLVAARPLTAGAAFGKAVFDKVVSALLLVLASPLLAAVALLVKLDSPGPILFLQRREGLNGSSFVMFKFRTMIQHCERSEHRQATRRDSRCTRLGRVLRRFSLDELPQLLNVLRGDMSLVGPRPHLASTRACGRLLSDIVPGYKARQRMKPGITGWAQIQGLRGETRTVQEVADRVAHDLHYIENWSFAFDLRILVGTLLREVFSRSGKAY